jgi:hypothetical protein
MRNDASILLKLYHTTGVGSATFSKPRHCALLLGATLLAFLMLRLPAALCQSGGQDEDYFAVPGWTILKSGLPRIPYVPSRDPRGVFYRADELLGALPPAYFYWQAAVYAVIGPGYGSGRVASLLAGSAALILVFELGRRWFESDSAGLWAAAIYSMTRVFFFPAGTARPDMFCCAVGLGAALALTEHRRIRGNHSLIAGLFTGLAMLSHPFAIVMGIQFGVWTACGERSWRARLKALAVFGFGAASVFSLWGLVAAANWPAFHTQLVNNVLGRAGPGLLNRLISPSGAISAQARLFFEQSGWLQTALFAGVLLTAFIYPFRKRRAAWLSAGLASSSAYLLVVFQGSHPSKGYWCYPAAFACISLGGFIAELGWKGTAVGFAAFALLLPGSGLRAAAVYFREWNNPDYSHPVAVRTLLAESLADAAYLVDVGCVLDFYLAKRNTTLALNIAPFFEAKGIPFDYLVITRTGIRQRLPTELGAWERVRTLGKPDDDLAIYVEVWRRTPKPADLARLRLRTLKSRL